MLWAVDPTHAMSHCSSTWEILSCMVHGVLECQDRLKSSWNDLHHSCNQLHDGMGMLRDLGSRTRLGSMVGLREAGLMEELERSHWGVEKSPSLEAVKPVLTKPDLMEGQAWSRDSREPPPSPVILGRPAPVPVPVDAGPTILPFILCFTGV